MADDSVLDEIQDNTKEAGQRQGEVGRKRAPRVPENKLRTTPQDGVTQDT